MLVTCSSCSNSQTYFDVAEHVRLDRREGHAAQLVWFSLFVLTGKKQRGSQKRERERTKDRNELLGGLEELLGGDVALGVNGDLLKAEGDLAEKVCGLCGHPRAPRQKNNKKN